jgi:pilus assembly protein FimV
MDDKIALILQGSISTGRCSPLWKKGALATAAALSLLGAHLDAQALALGAAQVKSALGEPLRAEVEVPDITSEEAAAFQATLGTPQEFQAAGVDYSEALRGTRITLSHRPNGQAYLSVQGQQPVNQPFLSIVIDASWSGGHVVRDYTLLIDPPRPQAAASAAPPARQSNAPVITGTAPKRHPVYPDAGSEAAAASGPAATSAAGQQVRVQPGDTAAAIVSAYQTENVSLDQMLVALLRANPQAFIHRNVNLIRAGAVVNILSADQSAAVSPASAHRMVIAQSRDFRAYRQGLAKTAARGSRRITTAARGSATGNVQPQVQEIGAAPPPDRLTLSHGPTAGKAPGAAGRAETHLAQSRHAQEQAAREAELRRNISELSQLAGASGSAAAASSATAASAAKPSSTPVINVQVPKAIASAMPAQQSTASAPAAAQPTASTAASAAAPQSQPARAQQSQPAQPGRAPRSHPITPPPPQPSFIDTLLDNWPMLGGILAIILLLAGYGWYRARSQKRKNNETTLNSDLLNDSKLPPDSYVGASGGQRVDTRSTDNADANSSMAYSPSQLEAVGDVDPVSEADVYLAYGRDAQAEEILREALRTYPGRTPIYLKLAEIYAKQRNARQLEAVATEARRITHGEGHDWQAIANLGRQLDPGNALYASDNVPMMKTPVAPPPVVGADANPGRSPDSQNSLDLDLTSVPLSAPMPQAQAPQQASPSGFSPRPSVNYTAPVFASMSTPVSVAATEPLPLTAQRDGTDSALLHPGNIDFTPPAPAQPQEQPNSGMIEFDADAFSDSPVSPPPQGNASPVDEDPLTTKLALAQEFHAIGDTSSARSLAREVLAEASGTLKTKTEQFLNDLD